MSTKLRASHMRCAPGYCYNDFTVLIIGKPNTGHSYNIDTSNPRYGQKTPTKRKQTRMQNANAKATENPAICT